MSIPAYFPSRAVRPAIGLGGVPRLGAAGLAVWLSRLASSASGLLPALVPPLLGYALIFGMASG
jgi:hypothetical protein